MGIAALVIKVGFALALLVGLLRLVAASANDPSAEVGGPQDGAGEDGQAPELDPAGQG